MPDYRATRSSMIWDCANRSGISELLYVIKLRVQWTIAKPCGRRIRPHFLKVDGNLDYLSA